MIGNLNGIPLADAERGSPGVDLRRFTAARLDGIEIGNQPPAIVEDILFPRTLVVAFGESSCGKSFFISHMALHAAAGWTWGGKATMAGAVVYITAEGAMGFRKRMVAFRQELKPPLSTPFYVISDAPDLGHDDGDADELIARIREQTGGQVSIVVVDTLARVMFGADESSAKDVSVAVANAGKITAALGATVILVHHAGKDASKGARGSSALRAAADTEILVEKTEIGRTATITKSKDAEGGLTIAFDLQPVDISGSDGETSCVVEVQTWQSTASTRPSKVTGPSLVALRALEDVIAEHGETPPASSLLPRTNRVVREALWRDACSRVQITETDSPDAKRKAFKRAAEKLQAANLIGKFEDWIWLSR